MIRALRRIAVLAVAVPLLTLGATSAANADSGGGSSLLPCDSRDGGYYCDANDIAGLLSGLLNPIFNVTCLDPESTVFICRVNTDNTPYGG